MYIDAMDGGDWLTTENKSATTKSLCYLDDRIQVRETLTLVQQSTWDSQMQNHGHASGSQHRTEKDVYIVL